VYYEQATSRSGSLHVDDYFDPLEEACLAWLYDPDFDSERYYEHENQLLVDEEYAAAFQEQLDHRSEGRRNNRQGWIGVWNDISHKNKTINLDVGSDSYADSLGTYVDQQAKVLGEFSQIHEWSVCSTICLIFFPSSLAFAPNLKGLITLFAKHQ
jgi:hypothetical protein